MKKTDVLILGSGVAGLSTAIRLATKRPDLSIKVVTKTDLGETNTRYAQGGISAVWNFELDDFQKHIEDTLDAGDGLCDNDVVRFIVEEGHQRVKDLIDWGARFDLSKEGEYDLGIEGGHSENRILHYKDQTGLEIQRALMAKIKSFDNVTILENYFAINLITQHHLGLNLTRLHNNIECYGAYILDKENLDVETHLAKVTVIATGGAGQIYRATTNPEIATGDGIAMLYRAKGRLANMEFVQFHPTSLYNPPKDNPVFLVSEAVRGMGAILRDKDGNTFMEHYDKRKSLAPRDIVARAIDNEMKKSGLDYVNLDCRHLDKDEFIAHFPTIYNKCLSIGIDPMKDYIPVTPACHYFCGGIKVDKHCQTSIKHLYACGECTSSGL
ncbi:MAG: FAD-dependent oxidoreductase, partial [Bacteroidota bacterium]